MAIENLNKLSHLAKNDSSFPLSRELTEANIRSAVEANRKEAKAHFLAPWGGAGVDAYCEARERGMSRLTATIAAVCGQAWNTVGFPLNLLLGSIDAHQVRQYVKHGRELGMSVD